METLRQNGRSPDEFAGLESDLRDCVGRGTLFRGGLDESVS